MNRLAALTCGLVCWMAALALFARPAQAIPVFARRYGTSCQTCHVVFPRLTPFGEAFRRNGYRFPDGRDEDFRRQEPQALGASAYRDLFPRSVWPGEIPSAVPISVFMSSTASYDSGTPSRVNLANVGGTVRFTTSATLGDHFSVWAGVNVAGSTSGAASVSLERAFLNIAPFDRPTFTVRVGRFEPGVFGFSSHRLPGPMPWILSAMVRDNPFMLEPTQLGAEATGVVGRGRVAYTAGYVASAGNQPTVPRDFYGRVAIKLGGLRLDGISSSGEVDISAPQPWREWSVQLGAFGYMGQANIGNPAVASQDDRFWVAGGDINATLRDFLLIGAYSIGHNARPSIADTTFAPTSHNWMVQLDWVHFPWLVPGARVEQNILDGQSHTRIIGQVYALVRANIRTSVTAIFEQPVAGSFGFASLQGNVSLGF